MNLVSVAAAYGHNHRQIAEHKICATEGTAKIHSRSGPTADKSGIISDPPPAVAAEPYLPNASIGRKPQIRICHPTGDHCAGPSVSII